MHITFESEAGSPDRPNEDWAAATPHGVIVLDGVTAPRVAQPGCRHPVTWYTETLGSRLLARLSHPCDIRELVGDAINEVADLHHDTCDLTNPGQPAAAVAIVRQTGDELEWLVLADIAVVMDGRDELRVVCDTRVERAAPAALARTRTTLIGTDDHRAAVAAMSVEQLQQRNVVGGYWVAASDRHAADHALTGRVNLSDVHRLAILSDGASRIADLFAEMTWAECLDYMQAHGPGALIRLVRRIEMHDPDGRRWPRFKCSDDATAAFLLTHRH